MSAFSVEGRCVQQTHDHALGHIAHEQVAPRLLRPVDLLKDAVGDVVDHVRELGIVRIRGRTGVRHDAVDGRRVQLQVDDEISAIEVAEIVQGRHGELHESDAVAQFVVGDPPMPLQVVVGRGDRPESVHPVETDPLKDPNHPAKAGAVDDTVSDFLPIWFRRSRR